MTTASYHNGCFSGSQEHGKTAVWVVNFNNGNVNVNNNHRNNNACVRAVRSSEYQGIENTVSLKCLHGAWKKARSGKKPSANQLAFDARWADGLLNLQQQINDGSWQPKPSACFIATKPKAREIHAPDFSDRVVHHWLIPQLESIWEPLFIHDSYANRKGKGSHAAVQRLKQFVRQVHDGERGGWYLQLDIHNFFNSIHRPTLWEILKKKLIKTKQPESVMRVTHSLLRKPPLSAGVIFHGTKQERSAVPLHKRLENAARGCGLPIGNFSSQFFANVYLDRLDQFVKHTLKAARYLRYVDDFVLIHNDRNQLLRWQHDIENFIVKELRLKLKPDIRLRPLRDGIDFLGYIIYPSHTMTRRRVVTSARTAISAWENHHVKDGKITATPKEFREITAIAASYEGHFQHSNSTRLKQSINKRFNWLNTAIRKRKFHYLLEETNVELKIHIPSTQKQGFTK